MVYLQAYLNSGLTDVRYNYSVEDLSGGSDMSEENRVIVLRQGTRIRKENTIPTVTRFDVGLPGGIVVGGGVVRGGFPFPSGELLWVNPDSPYADAVRDHYSSSPSQRAASEPDEDSDPDSAENNIGIFRMETSFMAAVPYNHKAFWFLHERFPKKLVRDPNGFYFKLTNLDTRRLLKCPDVPMQEMRNFWPKFPG